MMPFAATYRMTIAAIAVVGFIGGAVTAQAQEASSWDRELHAAARLIAGPLLKTSDAAWLSAGIEIRLDPGWKTYWRYPGDSGVPPTFDFTGSENVKSVTTLWPAPQRFTDEAGGHSIGYSADVILPLRIVPQDARKPSSLHVKLSYAVCGDLCAPAQADLNLMLPAAADVDDQALIAAEARVPRRITLGSHGDGRLAVYSVRREKDHTPERVIVEVAAPEGVPVDLFAEGPTADWTLPLPEPSDQAAGDRPGLHRFAFNLDGLPPGARTDGVTLILTAVSPSDAIEVETHLD